MSENNITETRNPEELKAQLQLKHQAKAAAITGKKENAGPVHFVRNGKVYKPLVPAAIIPGLGRRTALEICADKKAQDYLIREGCVGSVIEEVK